VGADREGSLVTISRKEWVGSESTGEGETRKPQSPRERGNFQRLVTRVIIRINLILIGYRWLSERAVPSVGSSEPGLRGISKEPNHT
jgi:hypothetical protein